MLKLQWDFEYFHLARILSVIIISLAIFAGGALMFVEFHVVNLDSELPSATRFTFQLGLTSIAVMMLFYLVIVITGFFMDNDDKAKNTILITFFLFAGYYLFTLLTLSLPFIRIAQAVS